MRRNRVVSLLAVAAVVLVVAGAVAAVRRGFSARDQPSALETYVARTARRLAVPFGRLPITLSRSRSQGAFSSDGESICP